eukprot:g2788.t1
MPKTKHVPVFRPTLREFLELGLEGYTKAVLEKDPGVLRAGLAKIVPPPEWTWIKCDEGKRAIDCSLDEIKFRPIKQCASTHAGVTHYQFQELPVCSLRDFRDFSTGTNDNNSNNNSSRRISNSRDDNSYRVPKALEEVLESRELDDLSLSRIEKMFFRSLRHTAEPHIYGADVDESLFRRNRKACGKGWDLSRLDSVLRKGLTQSERNALKGVATPSLYCGLWGSAFAWHTEDKELNSVNYIHYGAPKVWYSVSPANARRFEALARSLFASEAVMCPEFLRHKCSLISPRLIQANGIPVHRIVCYEKELIVTFPRAYHCGFNVGFNVAESVNFATPRWIPFGAKAKHCSCQEPKKTKKDVASRKRRKRKRSEEHNSVVRLNVDRMIARIRQTDASIVPRSNDDQNLVVENWIQCTQCKRWHRGCPLSFLRRSECEGGDDEAVANSFVCAINTWTSNVSLRTCKNPKRQERIALPETFKAKRIERLAVLIRTKFLPVQFSLKRELSSSSSK